MSGATGSRDEFPDPPTGPFIDVSAAPVIVVGTVGESSAYWSDEDQLIYTVAEFAVTDTQRGDVPDTIRVRNVGGVVGDLTIKVTHQPSFERGTRSRLFLTSQDDGTYLVVGGEDGKQDSQDHGVAEALSTCGAGVFAGDGYCLANERFPNTAFPVPLKVNPNTTDVIGEDTAVTAAFATWVNEPNSRVEFVYTGTTTIACLAHDGVNVVYWTQAPNQCGAQCNVTACSLIAAQNGIDVIGYDTWMNDSLAWSIGAAPGKHDVQTVALHESGHWLGLTHTIGDCNQVMGVISDGPPGTACPIVGTTKRNLNSGDQRGIQALYPGDNVLLKAPPDTSIYAMRQNLGPPADSDATGRRLIHNPVTFEGNGFAWGNVLTTRSNFLSAFPQGDPLIDLRADGVLLKGTPSTVWAMQGTVRRGIPNPTVLANCGYGFDGVFNITDGTLSAIPSGSNMTSPPPPCPHLIPPHGYLVKGSGSTIYVMSGSTKRAIASEHVFLNVCGYRWGDVNTLADSYMNDITSGSQLTGQPCP